MASSLTASERLGFSCGFFNSQDGDRTYSAEEFGSIFDGIIKDGVYRSIEPHFQVTADTKLKVKVGEGRAWLLHTWSLITRPQTLTCDAADPLNRRVDAVVLTVDHRDDVRGNKLSIKKGTASRKTRDQQIADFDFLSTRADNYAEYPLAYIDIPAEATSLTNENIVNAVGIVDIQGPPFVTCPLESVDLSSIYAHLQAQYEATMDHNYIAWRNWFTHIQYELDGDVAGHLQRQIDEIKKYAVIYYVDSVLYIPMSAASIDEKKLIFAT